MDISRICSFPLSAGEVLTEVIPLSSPDIFNKDAYLLFEEDQKLGDITDSDALRAVKRDPAVLQVQLTLNTRKPIEATTTTHSPRSSEKKEFFDNNFESMMLQQEAALLSLTPAQFDLLMRFTQTIRQQRHNTQKQMECAFCKNNGEPLAWYSMHPLKDGRGRVRCPVLRGYRCPRCGASGDWAHTIKYCPINVLTGLASNRYNVQSYV